MRPLVEIRKDIGEKNARVNALFDESDTKNGGIDDAETKASIIALNKEIEDLEKEAADSKEMDDIRASADRRRTEMKTPAGGGMDHPGATGAKGNAATRQAVKTLGQMFTDMPEWRDYLKSVAPTGHIGDKQPVNSPSLVLQASIKALITGLADSSAGAFVVADQSGIYDPLGRRPLTIRDIISVRTTGSDVIEYVRQLTRSNAAAPVAEATASDNGSGVKPEGGMTFERKQANVKTIAEWVPATKRSLSDAGQLRGIIDDELRADLEEQVETQIMQGDGTGENFEGIDAVSGTQDQAYDTSPLITLRKARTKIRTVGRAIPTAWVMNPSDWETIDLAVDNEQRYYFGGPLEMGTPRIWGLAVIESEAQPVGNAWGADWRRAVLWDREQASISVSDAHSDFFIRNLVAILGELRAAFAVIRPAAFIEVDLTP